MLAHLRIENIAVIERAEIDFAPGFNVLTGETGAGKSIVVDAIGAITGERTSRDLIRTGAKTAVAEAVFSGLKKIPCAEELGLAPDDQGNFLIHREIAADGKNICRAGGKQLTVSQLRMIGGQLLNIHGQHDGQLLLDEASHLQYLDRFGGHEGLLADYRAAYGEYGRIAKEMAALQMDEAEKSRRIDTLEYQIEELTRAQLQVGEDEALAARRDLLRNAGKLREGIERAYAALSGADEDSDGAIALLAEGERAIRDAARLAQALDPLAEQMTQLCALAEDALDGLWRAKDDMEFSPQELDAVEGRLDMLFRLRKKYGATAEEMLEYLERCKQELDQITYAEDTVLRLEQERSAALERARAAAAVLSSARREAARRLEARICKELSELDMGGVHFAVELDSLEGEALLREDGADLVRFLMSANAGEAMKSISRVASGGELARIMLAMKNVLAENDDVGTLVFDEVDTGVSGRAARRVAEKLSCVSHSKQVLCVTHLPQIAAMADVHFTVEKEEAGGRTYTKVSTLSREQRRAELARITGGVQVTQAMLQGAEELLASSEAYKLEASKTAKKD